jgi:hypothetical protein
LVVRAHLEVRYLKDSIIGRPGPQSFSQKYVHQKWSIYFHILVYGLTGGW